MSLHNKFAIFSSSLVDHENILYIVRKSIKMASRLVYKSKVPQLKDPPTIWFISLALKIRGGAYFNHHLKITIKICMVLFAWLFHAFACQTDIQYSLFSQWSKRIFVISLRYTKIICSKVKSSRIWHIVSKRRRNINRMILPSHNNQR